MTLMELAKDNGQLVELRVCGSSMEPTIKKGAIIKIENINDDILIGDVIVFLNNDHLTVHRVINMYCSTQGKQIYVTKGDNCSNKTEIVTEENIIGKVFNYLNP
jgi:signal peptidase I